MRRTILLLAMLALAIPGRAVGQLATELSSRVRDRYVKVSAPAYVLRNVTLIDGTGAPARLNQSVVIEEGRITQIGTQVAIPPDAELLNLSGHTLIPGMVGLHDHLFYMAAGGRAAQLSFSGPRLYLGAGVTTVRTTGSEAPYSELNLKAEIERGRVPGPRIHITAPYITGGQGNTTMTLLNSPEQARRFVAYWGEEGATWLKAYTNIRRAELKAAIEEAHARGMKVTGHICSISFTEAVDLGIDNIEHGLLTNSDYHPDKQPDRCPRNNLAVAGNIDVSGPEVAATFRKMIDAGVAMTSTLAVYELFVPNRPTKDPRALEAMSDDVREVYLADRERIDNSANPRYTPAMLQNAMAYERRFVEMGGLLAAGVDPTGNGGALPGYGDQRNVELLSEAGFSIEEVVRIVSLNGAEVLGVEDELGSIEVGKIADMVLLRGDLTQNAAVIKNTVTVFKDGVGYDSRAMLREVRGLVGIR
ncbi:MAG: amidohydrolase family protein [Gemmatimonadota bacterium]|nr:MAG: amidohydrolase family protein [Gemmatimonadota bacterium]